MSGKLAKAMEGRRSDLPKRDGMSPSQRKALWTLRKEARQAGSLLSTGGKGGLDSTLVLGVMRRDKYKCKACGEPGTKENGGLGVHHKNDHLEEPKKKAKERWLEQHGQRNKENAIVAICARCHDRVHEKDRAKFGDAEQRAHPERH